MLKNTLQLLLFCIGVTQVAQAGVREQYLRRVSFLIRGVPPAVEDINSVANLSEDAYKKKLDSKITEYLNSDLYAEKMRLRYLELLRLKISPYYLPVLYQSDNFLQEYIDKMNHILVQRGSSVLDNYLIDLFKSDESLNLLLTGTQYSFNEVNKTGLNELDFYQDIFNVDKFSQAHLPIKLVAKTQQQKQSLAGIITTPRFFERYFSSSTNLNRRRAAAVFRVFLCNDISLGVGNVQSEKDHLMAIALNKKAESDNSISMNSPAMAKTNANDNKCNRCHYSLDPLGKAFEYSLHRLTQEPIEGRLKYEFADSKVKVNVPFKNLNEMGQVIVKQKEFSYCQAQHMWNWFVGKDIENKKLAYWSSYLDQQSRKPKKYIKKLLIENYDLYKKTYAEKAKDLPSFDDTFKRSLQNFDFYQSLQSQFKLDYNFFNKCKLEKYDLSSLGLVDPKTGQHNPINRSLPYFQIIHKCAKGLMDLPSPVVKVDASPKRWGDLKLPEKKELINKIVVNILGQNLYSAEKNKELVENLYLIVDDHLRADKKITTIDQVINVVASYVVLTPEYLDI